MVGFFDLTENSGLSTRDSLLHPCGLKCEMN